MLSLVVETENVLVVGKGLHVTYSTVISTCQNADFQNTSKKYIMFISALILLLLFYYHALYSI